MYKGNILNLYIGKSQLKFLIGKQEINSNIIFKHIWYIDLPQTEFGPDVCVLGNFNAKDNTFTIDNHNKHRLCITGVPLGIPDLDYYKLKTSIWSSYFENVFRGALFQVVPEENLDLSTMKLIKV